MNACQDDPFIPLEDVHQVGIPPCYILSGGQWVIDSQEEFDLLFDPEYADVFCLANLPIPIIDFETRTLLGRLTEEDACDVSYMRDIFVCPSRNQYRYHIHINRQIDDDCMPQLFTAYHWITVPKLPDNYDVDFEVSYGEF